MRIMGLDLGARRIGVALSDELCICAQGLEVIERDGSEMERLRHIAGLYGVGRVVVGFPLLLSGGEGSAVRDARVFAQRLQAELKLDVVLWDERMTTKAAESALLEMDVSRRKRKKVIDKVAAVLILQGYLESIRTEEDKE